MTVASLKYDALSYFSVIPKIVHDLHTISKTESITFVHMNLANYRILRRIILPEKLPQQMYIIQLYNWGVSRKLAT